MSDPSTVVDFFNLKEEVESKGFTLDLSESKGKPVYLVSHELCEYSTIFTGHYGLRMWLAGVEYAFTHFFLDEEEGKEDKE